MPAIRTTHTGSLPRPDDLADMLVARDLGDTTPGVDDRVGAAVVEVVERQRSLGLDVVNDGEMGRLGYALYIKDRLTGFDGESIGVNRRRPEMDEHPDYAVRWKARLDQHAGSLPACTGDIRTGDLAGVRADIANLEAAAAVAGIGNDRLFLTAASPGVISIFFPNQHYSTREAYLGAIADAMRAEYEAIASAGITLQLDCPDLAMSRHMMFADLSLDEFRREAALDIEALNHAVANIPPERMRFHVCWGNYEGPHTHDVSLMEIVDLLLRARPAGISIEACNPRHGHEWRVWEDVKLPDGKYLIPGVIDSTNNYVEHPDLVAQRLLNYARLVGPESVVGGSDCGFGTNVRMMSVAPTITWAKLRSLVEGAELASREFGA